MLGAWLGYSWKVLLKQVFKVLCVASGCCCFFLFFFKESRCFGISLVLSGLPLNAARMFKAGCGMICDD